MLHNQEHNYYHELRKLTKNYESDEDTTGLDILKTGQNKHRNSVTSKSLSKRIDNSIS